MYHIKKPLVAAVIGAFVLTACTQTGPRQNSGAGIGAALGGLFGATRSGGNLGATAAGVVAGGIIGGAIGQALDKQAGDIRSAVNNSDIEVVNTGSELIVTMPNDILFATDSATVGSGLTRDLASLAGVLIDYPASTINVVGHTDNVGEASYNLSLSRRRAASVAGVLMDNGVSAARLVTIGRGEDEPVASNLTASGRQQNRRVEIIIRPNT
ncbi:MAG: OmpA family protein [Rhodobacteraceae bacterium]|nr:OmpA family protein [Paracoccaceae bacterium]